MLCCVMLSWEGDSKFRFNRALEVSFRILVVGVYVKGVVAFALKFGFLVLDKTGTTH